MKRFRVSSRIVPVVLLAGLLLAAAPTAEAQYRYGRALGGEADGWYVQFEATLANPRNVDGVVATSEIRQTVPGGTNRQVAILPEWDDDVAGSLAVGYQWAGGASLQVSYSGFQTDTTTSGDGLAAGEILHLAVGPPIFTGSGYVGDSVSPGYFDLTHEVETTTFDVEWGKALEIGDAFTMRWTTGLRYAEFDETVTGFFDEARSVDGAFGQARYAASKSNVGEMFGVKLGAEGSFKVTPSISLSGRLGVSFLDGEITADSGLRPTGTVNASTTPGSLASFEDDSRSGSIREVEIRATWHAASDRVRVWLGWEQEEWKDIASDSLRNFPGTVAPLRSRDSVTFSGVKLGVQFRF